MRRRPVSHNFLLLSVASIVGSVMALVANGYLGRVLGVSGFGVLAYARTVLEYCLLPATLGLTVVGSREIAASLDDGPAIAGRVVAARGVMAGISVLAWLAAVLVTSQPALRMAILVMGAMIPLSVVNVDWLYSAYEDQALPSIARTAGRLVYAGSVLLFVRGPAQVWLAAALLVFELAVVVGITAPKAWRHVDLGAAVRDGWRGVFAQIRRSLGAGLAALGSRIKTNIDVLMLGLLATSQAIGYYSAAYRLVFFIQTIAGLYATVILPRLARADSDGDSSAVVRDTARLAFVGGSLMVGVVAPLAPDLLVLVFGAAFAPAGPVLTALTIAGACIVVSLIFGSLAIAVHLDRYYVAFAWSAAALNVAMNLVLIPRLSFYGAAISTLATELLLAGCFTTLLWKRGVGRALGPKAIAGLIAVCAVPAFLGRVVLAAGGGVIAGAVAAGVAWVAVAMLGRLVTRADVARLTASVRGRSA
jgi:O-antigen/teichoic acid export membrane protein